MYLTAAHPSCLAESNGNNGESVMSVDLKALRRTTDTAYVSPFAPFPAVLAPAAARDYTITPTYEVPMIAGTAQKLNNIRFKFNGQMVSLECDA